jgi:hypothetical protein
LQRGRDVAAGGVTIVANSLSVNVRASGDTRSKTEGDVSWKNGKSKDCSLTL